MKIPKNVRKSVREEVYRLSDESNYLSQSRSKNSQFMDELTRNPDVGGVLKKYMPEGRVKTYIKDAILHNYSEEMRKKIDKQYDTKDMILDFFGQSREIDSKGKASLYKSTERLASYCVVSKGTADKWETALKHALNYLVRLSEETQSKDIRVALICTSPRGKLPESDKKYIKKALNKIGVKFFCIEY